MFKKVDAVVIHADDLNGAIAFYLEVLGTRLLWKSADSAAVAFADSDTELVISTRLSCETDLLVESVDHAVQSFTSRGGVIVTEPQDIPVGRVAVVADPFGNHLTLVDLSKGRYITAEDGTVQGIAKDG